MRTELKKKRLLRRKTKGAYERSTSRQVNKIYNEPSLDIVVKARKQ